MKQRIPLLPLLSGLCVMLLALLPARVYAVNIVEKTYTGQEIVDNWAAYDPNYSNFQQIEWPSPTEEGLKIPMNEDGECNILSLNSYFDIKEIKFELPGLNSNNLEEPGLDINRQYFYIESDEAGSFVYTNKQDSLSGIIDLHLRSQWNGRTKEYMVDSIVVASITVKYDADGCNHQMHWSQQQATAVWGKPFEEPTLEGMNLTNVRYSSSDTSVAHIDPETGKITLQGAGTAVITAKIAAEGFWADAEASYTLTVVGNSDYTQGSVNVATPGTLQQLIVDMDEVPQSLTVTGCLNAEDVVYIREGRGSMAQVKEIDLSAITLQPGPGCYSSVVVGSLAAGIGNRTMKFYIDNTFHCDTTSSNNGLTGYVNYNVYNNQLYGAFAGNTTLEKVVLPAGNEAVGQYMFCDSNIKRVGFPSAPNAIEKWAFKNTPELLSLNIPASVQKIEDRAFQESGLTEFTLPDGCTSIGDYAFYKTPLHSINLGHVTEMGGSAFYQTKIQSTDLSGLTEIPTELFYCSDLRSITFNPALKSIGAYAFYGNKNLLSVVLPEGLEKIGANTFNDCSKLRDITIPSTLSVIGYSGFPWNWVREQPVEDGIYYVGHVAYSLADSWPSNPELTFKEGTVSISPTFGDRYIDLLRYSLKKITFPSTMKIIGTKDRNGDEIFWRCEDLEEVVFNEGLETIGNRYFDSCKKLKVPYWPGSLRYIGEKAFYSTQVSSLPLGADMEYCGNQAFSYCPSLATVKLYTPNLLTDGGIFYGSGVEKVVIGKEVQRVPNNFLSGLENLVRIIWEDPDAEGPALEIGNGAFYKITSMEVDIPKRTRRIGEEAFSRAKTKDIDLSLVDSIGAYAFNNSSGLVNLNIGKNCHYCGKEAFYDLPTLRTVYWNMPTTEYSPFYGYCKPAIVEMTIGPDVEFLPSNFCTQSSLETLNFEPRGAQSRSEAKGLLIDEEAFRGNQWLETVNFPDCRTAIGANAFEGCTSLVNLRLGAGLENIDKRGFYWCPNLKSVDIPESVVEIGEEAFKCFYSGEGVEKLFFHNEAGVWLQQSICGTNVDIFVPGGSEEAYKNTSLRNNPIIPYAITSLTLSDEEIDIPDGQLYPLEAAINPAEFDGLNIVWESSDTTVATVGADGMVEAIATGTATVKAYIRFMPEYFAECTVKVNGGAGVEQVAEDPDTISVKVENGAIVASGFEGTMEVYDLAGRLVALSTNGRVNGLLPGLYIVKAGGLTAKVRL